VCDSVSEYVWVVGSLSWPVEDRDADGLGDLDAEFRKLADLDFDSWRDKVTVKLIVDDAENVRLGC